MRSAASWEQLALSVNRVARIAPGNNLVRLIEYCDLECRSDSDRPNHLLHDPPHLTVFSAVIALHDPDPFQGTSPYHPVPATWFPRTGIIQNAPGCVMRRSRNKWL